MTTVGSNVNPELEELRQSVPIAPNTENKKYEEIIQKMANVHAGYLFDIIGKKLLQELCILLGSVKNKKYASGWNEIGAELGLRGDAMNCFENMIFKGQDDVSKMFLAYTKKPDPTISKIYVAVYTNKRYDIITRTYEMVMDLYDVLKDMYGTDIEQQILCPDNLPDTPLIMKDFENYDIKEIYKNLKDKKNEIEILCKSAPIIPPQKHATNTQYDKYVMLTYGPESIQYAKRIAKVFKKERNGKKIGVIMLDKQANLFHIYGPEIFIANCYSQSNYIIPIITPDYLNVISGINTPSSALGNIDSKYAKYINSLMTEDYINSGCMNYKIRCIIPDELFNQVQQYAIIRNPEYRVWTTMSDVNKMAKKILAGKI